MSLPVTEPEHAHSTPSTRPVATTAWGLFRGAFVVAVVLLLVGALAWLVFGYGTGNFVDTDAKRVVERQKILADRNAEDYKLLHDPASFMAKDKGIVRVPIDQAMAMTIPELQKVEPHPAYPITQSPPQPANAPTSPDKGVGAANAANNPSASNPTVGQPSPALVAATPTPAPATSASNAPSAPAPAAPVAPATGGVTAAVPAVPSAAATPPTPAPAATAVPTGTPMGIAAPSPDNNANNPGNPPVPGTSVQPGAPTPATGVPAAAPVTGSKPEPLTAPPSQPTPAGTAATAATDAVTPTPVPIAPGASPAGTP